MEEGMRWKAHGGGGEAREDGWLLRRSRRHMEHLRRHVAGGVLLTDGAPIDEDGEVLGEGLLAGCGPPLLPLQRGHQRLERPLLNCN